MSRCNDLNVGGRDDAYDPDNLFNLEEAWQSASIPIYARENNWKVLRSLAGELECLDDEITNVQDAVHLTNASGERVDLHAALAGIDRKDGETDQQLKQRTQLNLRVGLSTTTADELIGLASTAGSVSSDDVLLHTDLDHKPSVLQVQFDASAFGTNFLSESEAESLLTEAVKAGARVEAVGNATIGNEFILKADGDPDLPEHGLTSDSISTGGELVSDLA